MLKITTYFTEPRVLGIAILTHFGTWIPDALYLKMMFRLKMGYGLNLKNPTTFNEKLQWLKLYNRNRSRSQSVKSNPPVLHYSRGKEKSRLCACDSAWRT